MTRLLLFAFTILLLSAAANAQTSVSGNITQNTTWTKAGSPYILTGNVGVTSTSTLTIEPGVVVQRASGYFYILFNGALQSAGTEHDSIAFVTPDTSEYPVAFLVFKKSNLNNTMLRFASFRFAGSRENVIMQIGNEAGGTQTNTVNSGTMRFSRCNLNGDIYQNDGTAQDNVLIDSCQVIRCFLSNTTPQAPPIAVTNSRLYYSEIANYSSGPATQLRNCQLTTCAVRAFDARPAINISRCELINTIVLSDSYTSFPGRIDSCTLINSPVAGGAVSITNTKFRATGYLRSLDDFSVDSVLIAANEPDVRNCEFSNESTHGIIGFYAGISGTPGYVTIIHNRFSNLYNGVIVQNFTGIQLDSNDFYTPGRYDIVNTSSTDFSALHNYFQLQGGQTIDDLILDQNDNLNYGLVTYIPYATSPNTGALPVTLVRFSGSKEGNTIGLNWQTSNEVNVASFVVQRKAGNGFADIGTVTASGSNGGSVYSFADALPLSGTNYYRLAIAGRDGSYTYSGVIPVAYTSLVNTWRVYPNPASSYIVVEYTVAKEGTQLQLTDADGRILKTITVAPGSTQTKMPVGDVAKGMYKVVIKTGSATESRTVLIQ